MSLNRLISQPRARSLIERMVLENRLPHALLFWGPAGSGKSVAAIELARWLNCRRGLDGPCDICASCVQFRTLEHAHFSYLLPVPGKALVDSEEGELTAEGAVQIAEILKRKGQEPYSLAEYPGGQNILIGQIRALLQWASKRAFDHLPQLALIDHAHRLREEAANALLKLLEEPPPNFILLLTAPAQEDILPTLRSRCQAVEFDRLKAETVEQTLRQKAGLDEASSSRVARLCGGNLSRALEFAAKPQEAEQLYELAINIVRYSLGRNPLEFNPLLESWSQRGYEDQLLVLEIISAWLRDAAILQSLGDAAQPKIIHQDRLDLLHKFVANCPRADFAEATFRVDEARRYLEGRALAPLTLISLARDLYRAIYQKQPV